MKAMVLTEPVNLLENRSPLQLVELPDPVPASNEVLIRVSACGVCHTELDEIEGRLLPPQFPVVLGHEVIGKVVETGEKVTSLKVGDRVGVGWIHSSTGQQDENVSQEFAATGRDANGGYAELMTVPEDYAYIIPDVWSDTQAAPLLCAGAIGYRALKLTEIKNGEPLGLTGFGGSAHLVLQLTKFLYPNSKIYVFARSKQQQNFARELGADWSGDTEEHSPEPLKAIIDTTPAWKPVVEALGNLLPGGRLVINAIRKQEDDKEELLKLSYHDHLWLEREIKTVANITHFDIREFLEAASKIPILPEVETYRLEDANQALCDLKSGNFRGAKVLQIRTHE